MTSSLLHRAVWSGLALAGLVACGEIAVDGHYRGEPLFEITGTVSVSSAALAGDPHGELRAALFWARPGNADAGNLDTVTAVEQEVGAASSFPAQVVLTVHEPPGASLVSATADVAGAFALARVLVYLDLDGDGIWDRGLEDLVGAANDSVVIYAPDGLGSGRYGVLAPGFHLLRRSAGAAACDAPFTAVAPSDMTIVVDMRFPTAALADVDCDGAPVEWSGTCPSPATVWSLCRGTSPPTDLCTTCEPLLWSEGNPDASCDSWLGTCEGYAEAEECEDAWEHCREEEVEEEEAETPEGETPESEPPESPESP